MDRFGVNDILKDASFVVEPLQEIVDSENSRLKKGFPITEVLTSFVTRTDNVLQRAPQSQQIPQIRNHVPEVLFRGIEMTLFLVGLNRIWNLWIFVCSDGSRVRFRFSN